MRIEEVYFNDYLPTSVLGREKAQRARRAFRAARQRGEDLLECLHAFFHETPCSDANGDRLIDARADERQHQAATLYLYRHRILGLHRAARQHVRRHGLPQGTSLAAPIALQPAGPAPRRRQNRGRKRKRSRGSPSRYFYLPGEVWEAILSR